ncbi:MAG: c-type cytochrome [Candidatus Rokubacteria bacterium]|nr:c-type cytochrome [Candidatus Rokubacteria bacterium]
MRTVTVVGTALVLFAGFAPIPGETVAAPSKGVGPVKQVKLGPIDPARVERGKQVFEQKCTACHKFEERYVGPALGGVTGRRSPEWIMNMILNPQGMLEKDPTAKDLLAEYFTPMTFQNVTEADARAILELARSVDQAKKGEKPEKAEKGAKPKAKKK